MVLVSVGVFIAVVALRCASAVGYAFLSDDSPLAWLSSGLLLANAAVAFSLMLSRRLPSIVGTFLVVSLTILALDEQFPFHERWKESVGPGLLGDAPAFMVAGRGTVGVYFVQRAMPGRTVRVLAWSAVARGVFALWIDVGQALLLLRRTEEAYEVLAESLFLCALLEAGRPQVQSAS